MLIQGLCCVWDSYVACVLPFMADQLIGASEVQGLSIAFHTMLLSYTLLLAI